MHQLRKFFEDLAPNWDNAQPLDRDEKLTSLVSSLDADLSVTDTLLDIGTGTGGIIPILRQRYPHTRIISIDLAFEMLIRARQKNADSLLAQADAHFLPFKTQNISAVICHNSFPHFQKKRIALMEFHRVLKPGGRLIVLHDMGRVAVNEIHQNAAAKVIRQDLLSEGKWLARELSRTGFNPYLVEDDSDHYLVIGLVE